MLIMWDTCALRPYLVEMVCDFWVKVKLANDFSAYKRSGTQPGDCVSHSPFQQMYVCAAAERSLSGTPMHLLLVDAPNRAIPRIQARLEPLRTFVSSYPLDGMLRASEKCSRPINGILIDTTSAFTDQPRLCYKKRCGLQHHPRFRAMINLQPRIRRPRFYSSRATGTHVAPTADSKRNALLSALFWPFSKLLRSPFRKTLPLQARF